MVQVPLDERLNTILQFGEMALQMKGGQGKRFKQFTCSVKYTAQAIHHTYNSIVRLCRSLLRVSYNYVLLGIFSTDPLEKEFRKLRQGFRTVQQIREKVNISKASLLPSTNVNVDSFNIESGHSWFVCCFY